MPARLVFPIPVGAIAPLARAFKVEPELLHRLLAVLLELYRRGIPFRISELYRDPERQAELYAQGRTKPGPIVTNAKPGQSKHNTGRAADVYVDDEHWQTFGELAEAAGLVWGGRWRSIVDKPHVELP